MISTDAASWKAVDHKARLAGYGLRPCPEAQPRGGHEAMTIGTRNFREEKWCNRLSGMLAIPFAEKVRGYAINRCSWENAQQP